MTRPRPDLLASGLDDNDLRRQVRRHELWRPHRGLYLPAQVPDNALARADAAVSCGGPGAVASGVTAARLLGLDVERLAPRGLDEVSIPPAAHRRHRPGLRVRRRRLAESDVTYVGQVPVTRPRRTVCDLLTHGERVGAIWLAEQAIARGLVAPEELAEALDRDRSRRVPGAARGRRRADQCRPQSQSLLETGMRIGFVDGGLPEPQLQIRVATAGGVFYLDMGYAEVRLGCEADGKAVHSAPEALFADRRRQNLLVDSGWRILRFTWADVFGRMREIVLLVRRHLEAAPRAVAR